MTVLGGSVRLHVWLPTACCCVHPVQCMTPDHDCQVTTCMLASCAPVAMQVTCGSLLSGTSSKHHGRESMTGGDPLPTKPAAASPGAA